MKSEKLWISSMIRRSNDVNEVLQDFGRKAGISGKDMLYLSLLTEETTGMATQMLKDFEGEIWIEGRKGRADIILEADVHSGGEESQPRLQCPAGFMAKVAEMLNCAYVFENANDMPENLIQLLPDYVFYGSAEKGPKPVWAGKWSLNACREHVREHRNDPAAGAFLEELEKSIVAMLADEVNIGIEGSRIRLVISRHTGSISGEPSGTR